MKCDGCQCEFQELKRTEKDSRFLCRDCSNPNLIRPVPFEPLTLEFFVRLDQLHKELASNKDDA